VTDITDKESAPLASPTVRYLRVGLAVTMAVAALAWAADLYRTVGWLFLTEQFLVTVFGLAIALTFVQFPARRKTLRTTLPWYDALIALAGLATAIYVALNYPDILTKFFTVPADGVIASWILFVLAVEGLRRTTGWPLVVIVLFFTVYALVGHLVPGALQTRQVEINRLMIYIGMDTSGMLGLTMQVGVTIVMPFLLFGFLLSASGGGNFFNDFALALMGRFRGGAAKIAVAASGLFGSISGIVVSNIMATGVVTIPLMKRSGFTARQAAAIEATASTGGQLMPPVMGAVAFLMADFLERPYRDVAIAALVPAILYYLALFIQADLEAAKRGIKRVEAAQIPKLGVVLRKGWQFALPFVVLIYALFWANQPPELAALYGAATTAIVGLVMGYGGQRMKPLELWRGLIATGSSSLDILMISAGAGFIMGILQMTGLGFALTAFLVHLGAGNVIALLVIAGLLCIVLGMGMPTIAVYVILAVLVAPSMVQVGLDPLPSHMFILYLGMMSFITPPVAIGAFFAASLAGAEPMRTGWESMRFGWTAFIIPFLFVLSPSLLLQSDSVMDTVLAISTAVIGVWFVSAGMIGYAIRTLDLPRRIGLLAGGFGLLLPPDLGTWAVFANIAGLILCVAIVGHQAMTIRRYRVTDVQSGAAE
jgi:TRAP transporter 4TM/12TM fusion protein